MQGSQIGRNKALQTPKYRLLELKIHARSIAGTLKHDYMAGSIIQEQGLCKMGKDQKRREREQLSQKKNKKEWTIDRKSVFMQLVTEYHVVLIRRAETWAKRKARRRKNKG